MYIVSASIALARALVSAGDASFALVRAGVALAQALVSAPVGRAVAGATFVLAPSCQGRATRSHR